MQQYQKFFKPCALGLCVLYLIFILFLPFTVWKFGVEISQNFGDLMSGKISYMGSTQEDDALKSAWVIVPLICGIGMVAATAMLPGKKAAAVCAIGAFMALIIFWIVRSDLADGASGASDVIKIGSGPILALITGLIAAVLCYMSDQGPRRDTTPGVGRGNGNEW